MSKEIDLKKLHEMWLEAKLELLKRQYSQESDLIDIADGDAGPIENMNWSLKVFFNLLEDCLRKTEDNNVKEMKGLIRAWLKGANMEEGPDDDEFLNSKMENPPASLKKIQAMVECLGRIKELRALRALPLKIEREGCTLDQFKIYLQDAWFNADKLQRRIARFIEKENEIEELKTEISELEAKEKEVAAKVRARRKDMKLELLPIEPSEKRANYSLTAPTSLRF